MKKLKCDSCGANLKVDENGDYAYCEYCNLKYKLKDDKVISLNLNMNDNTKDAFSAVGKTAAHIGMVSVGLYVVVVIVILAVIGFTMFSVFRGIESSRKEQTSKIEDVVDADKKDDKKPEEEEYDEFDIKFFNAAYEGYVGTKYKSSVESILDKVSTNNKTQSRIISVTYGDKVVTDSKEIISLKQSLPKYDGTGYNWVNYEVSLDYDDIGFVKNVNIEKLN